ALSYLSKCDDVDTFVGTGLRAVDGFRETMARLNYENVARGDIGKSYRRGKISSYSACLKAICEKCGSKS
ncbi:MAG: hypothetical protein IJW96_04705, partial [Clostridia bacterium]|nr:hypothetical protein [Clostridia bacterium]